MRSRCTFWEEEVGNLGGRVRMVRIDGLRGGEGGYETEWRLNEAEMGEGNDEYLVEQV
jgi:hypothetical protein